MKKNSKGKFQGKKTIALIVDGESECHYFNMLNRNEESLEITLKPKLPQHKKLSEQFKEVKKASDNYDVVFWIVDFDKLVEEDRARAKGKKSAIQEFKEYQGKLNNIKKVKILINNPCLEFWFYLHFAKTSRFFDNCSSVEKEVKKYLIGYEKTRNFFTKQDNDIYLKLKPLQKTAISNAKALGDFDINNPHSAISEMFVLFEGENKLI